MQPGDLVTPIVNFDQDIAIGAEFRPFIPIKNESICTISRIFDSGSFFLEEVEVIFKGEILAFIAEYWRKLDTISLEEVTELSKEAQENYQLIEKL